MAEPHEHVEHETVERRGLRRAPGARAGFGWGSLAARILLSLIGAAGMIVGAFLDWFEGIPGVDLDVRALWQTTLTRQGGTFVETVGFVLIVLGLLAIVGLAPRSGWLTRLVGALGIVAFVLFLIEVYRAGRTVTAVDPGAWVALAGGVVALLGGFFGTRPSVVAPAGTMVQ